MTTYRIGVKATALRYYRIDAPTLAVALDTWTDGESSHDGDEVVGEDGPVFAEERADDGTWRAVELPTAGRRTA